VVFIPKCHRKTLHKELRQYLGEVCRRLAEQKQSRVEEGHLKIPPKHAGPQVVRYITWHECIGSGSEASPWCCDQLGMSAPP
jgi:REP element-mobilizing transposase RayT